MNTFSVCTVRWAAWIVLFALVLVLATAANPLGVSAASDLKSSFSPAIPVANLLNADGTLNTKTVTSANLDLRGWNVTLNAKRGPIFSRAAKGDNTSPATLPPMKPAAVPGVWTPMPFQGVNSTSQVRAIVQAPNPGVGMGNGIYVAGTFAGSGDFPPTFGNLGSIARYYNGVWWPLPHGGLGNGQGVYAMAVVGSYIYVGGSFTRTSDSFALYNGTLNNIARYDTVTDTWSPMPDNGLNSTVWALGVANGHLYVGGAFTASQNNAYTNLNGIARYDGGSTWTALSKQGLNGTVYAIATNGNNVYIGGGFSDTVNPSTGNLNNIALYNDSSASWTALANNGVSGTVNALAFSGTNLYVGGQFSSALNPTVTLNNIAMYNGSWNAINSSGSIGLDALVRTITVIGTDIYVGGDFLNPNGISTNQLNRIALLNGSTWSSLPNLGLNNTVFSIAAIGLPALYNLYVGGSFDNVASGSVAGLGRVASVGNLCTSIASGNWSAGGTWGCGSAPSNSDQVTIANGQTITIDADGIMIDGPLTVNGTIDATAHILTLGASAVVAGTGQIIGTVVRNTPGNGTQTYSDPNTQITFSGSSLNAITVTLTIGNPGGGMTNSVGRKYTITPGTGTLGSANMRLPYKNSEFIGTISNEDNIKMWRFDSGQGRWVLQGGTADKVNKWVDITGVTQFSPWTMSDNGTGSPTAVTVSSLSANSNDSLNTMIIIGALLATLAMAGAWRLSKPRV